MKMIGNIILLIILLLSLNTCDTTEPPNNQTLALKLEDVSCTEAWVQLTTNNIQLPAEINLIKTDASGNSKDVKFYVSTEDTLLYIDSLLPNQTYKLQVSSIPQSGRQNPVSSNELSVTTMDTTSHNFTWQTWTFGGQAGSCALYDVAIIDENNIWAVGEIYMLDSLGRPDPNAYNAVHWNGQSWELKKIRTNTCGGVDYPPIKAIFAFSSNDILFAHIDGSISHFNGIGFTNDCSLITQLNGSANKMWGISKDDFYVVSGNGFIAHYINGSWIKIESRSNLQFTDIWGATDAKAGDQQILAVCTRNLPLDKGIYRILGNNVVQISSEPIKWELYALWFIPNRHYYVIGDGIYEKKYLSDTLWKDNGFDITHYATTGIRGNNFNDVFVSGAFGEFLHFNGVSWKSYINETGWFSGSYGGVAVKNNLVITVGYEGAQAKILMGYR